MLSFRAKTRNPENATIWRTRPNRLTNEIEDTISYPQSPAPGSRDNLDRCYFSSLITQ